MRKSARGAGSRRRALVGAVTLLVLLALALAAAAVRQVASESRVYLEDRERRLQQHLEVALSHLETFEESALADLVRAFTDDDGDPREVERSHPLVDRAFRVVENRVSWPRPMDFTRYGEELGAEEAGTPLARSLLDRAYRLLADGESERALEAFEHSLERKLPPSTRAEALLQMATLLAADGQRRQEAVTCFDRVLQLEGGRNAARAKLLSWRLAARYRKARLLLDDPDPSAGIHELIGFVEEMTDDDSLSQTGDFTSFYQDRSLEHLSHMRSEGALTSEQERRYSELETVVREVREEATFRRELEDLWLPALRAVVPSEANRHRIFRASARGPRLLVFRGEPGDASGLIGMRVDLSSYGDHLLDQLKVLKEGSTEGRDPRVLGPDGDFLFGADQLDGAETRWLQSELGEDLPWTVTVAASEDLRRFRVRRSLLYGGLVAIVVLVVTIATLTTLRGMQRAVELADLKSEFVANVSHELKTPLTVIRMFTDILLLGYTKDPAETQENLKLIARETENLSLLIDNVLDLSRIDAGEKQYHPAPADLPSLIRRVVDLSLPYLERRGFIVDMNLPAEFPVIEIDQAAFSRALSNLLSNAVKYSGDRKEVEIHLRLDDDHALVEVADRGVGLRPEETERVFDRFFRGNRSDVTCPEYPQAATGIGLAIVKHSVESHGGEVYAAAREGGGSRFTMKFPVRAGETQGERG